MTAQPVIALVLGAGGVRGMAHVGFLNVVERLGLRFDLVVGASAGALVGAAHASGFRAAEVERLALRTPLGEVFRFTARGAGFLDEAVLSGFLRGIFGERKIEELPTRFVAVAASLRHRSLAVLDRGPLDRAVRAAICVPLFWPPVPHEGDLLMDGGVIDGLPVGLARALGAERVVAVDVDPSASRIVRGKRAGRLRAMSLSLTERLLRAEPVRPTRRWVLLHQLHAALRDAAVPVQADLTIRPRLGTINANDFRHRARCAVLGERAAEESAEALLRLMRGA